jgi:hypothetical protein
MITASLKVFVFAASGYAVLRAAIWWCKMSMSDEERMRITLRPKDLFERHKTLVAMSLLELMCFGVAIAALIVAAITWAMSL